MQCLKKARFEVETYEMVKSFKMAAEPGYKGDMKSGLRILKN